DPRAVHPVAFLWRHAVADRLALGLHETLGESRRVRHGEARGLLPGARRTGDRGRTAPRAADALARRAHSNGSEGTAVARPQAPGRAPGHHACRARGARPARRTGRGPRCRWRDPVMEVMLLGIYSFFVWLIFFKFKWLPWNTVAMVVVVTIPVVGLTALILALNVFAPSSHDVRVIKYVANISSQVRGRVIEVADGHTPPRTGEILNRG